MLTIHLIVWMVLGFQETIAQVEVSLDTRLMQSVNQDAPVFQIEELLDEGASPNARTKDSVVPLMLASFLGNLKTTRLLLSRGAQVDAADAKGNTSLIYALAQNRPESNALIVSLLLSSGADANVRAQNGDTPLLVLTRTPMVVHRLDDLDALLKAGADVNAQGADKNTALMQVMGHARLELDQKLLTPLVMRLLEKKHDLSLTNASGQTVLDLARDIGNTAWIGAIEATDEKPTRP